jgi:16S rRNA C967 or C1407 C5-methylase (RsmB/RsmF family)
MNKFRENHLFKILSSFELQHLPLDVFLRNYFRSHSAVGAKDRRYLAETLYGMIRWRGLLDHLIGTPCTWEKRYACFLKINPLDFLKEEKIPPHIRVSFPKAFFQMIQDCYGQEKGIDLCRASNSQAPTTVRANLLKTTREALLEKWKDQYQVSATRTSPWGITFHRRINFFDTQEFKLGCFEVQDEGSQLVGALVEALPKQHVLDYCAGSGGKTLAFAPRMENKGVIYLHDIRPDALEEGRKRLRRAGVQNAQLLFPDDEKSKKALKGTMDWVLVDVPCSGTGTLRRNPDMKWRFNSAALERLLLEQRTIFEEALSYLNPEGKIVYATCSLLTQENEQQIDYFQKQFRVELVTPPFHSLPEVGGMDGFFAAVLKRG